MPKDPGAPAEPLSPPLTASSSESVGAATLETPPEEPAAPRGLLRRYSTIRETQNASVTETPSGERRLNQYEFGGVIGRGAFGTVHLAFDAEKQRPVAIKEFSKSKLRRNRLGQMGAALRAGHARLAVGRTAGRGGAAVAAAPANPIELVRGEIAIMKKLHHWNVVRLYEVLDDPAQDSLFMAYELCKRGPVLDLGGPEPPAPYGEAAARALFQQLLLGIEYLHASGVAHRDIKPDNLLLAEDGTLKISDFGVSEMFTAGSDRTSRSAGSPAFFAPELCRAGHGDVSAMGADIWAMGVTLFALVTGRLPFAGASIVELYERIRSDPLPSGLGVSAPLLDVLERMLDKDPGTRVSLKGLRAHPWVTNGGAAPLPPLEENLRGAVREVTPADLESAVTRVCVLPTVIKAVTKFRRGHRRRVSGASGGSGGSEGGVSEAIP